MRPTPDAPRPQPRQRHRRLSTRGRVILVVVVVALFVLIVSLRGVAGFYTTYLWFSSLHHTDVWGGVLGAKLALAAIFTAVFFVLLWVNLFIADRLAPALAETGPGEELVERYHQIVGRRTVLVRSLVALIFALIAGAGVSSQWNNWILFTHQVSFGVKDQTFHTDVGFYVFSLPFLTFLGSWLFAAFVIILIVTLVAHYLNGGIRVQASSKPRVTPQVKAHISVLLGVLALVKTYQYWLQRYSLTFSTRGTVNGALYTDTKVELKALYLLMLISVFALVLFIVNIWRRGWVLPVLAVGLWAFVAILAGAVVPAFVQRFRVQPAESSMERPYIEHNITATRAAIGLNKVKVDSFPNSGDLNASALAADAGTVRNVRLWDPPVIATIFQKQQGIRSFYEINDVNVDRYNLQNQTTQVMVANRDLNTGGVPTDSWEARHLAYTHGYGTVMAPANASSQQQPVLNMADIPVNSTGGAPSLTGPEARPEIYFGEGLNGYVIVDTKRKEIDYTDADGNTKFTEYDGSDGIKLGSGLGGFVNRAAFALRFGDINPLISSNIEPQSKVLLYRDVSARVHQLAPFLSFDSDPYPVVLNGHVLYVIDAYTTTDRYPNAQRASTSDLPDGSGLNHQFNYVRNSVKATVDAYTGKVTLYVVDPSDPIIRAYRKAFPGLFTDVAKAPKQLVDHFRYPDDLFRVQTVMWGRYHLTNPDDFYNQQAAWEVAQDPNAIAPPAGNITPVTDQNGQPAKSTDLMSPYYLLMRLPGDQSESFLQLRPFVPTKASGGRQVLTAFMVAKSDPGDYGHLETFELPGNNLPNGPSNIAAQMQQDGQVSQAQTLLCQRGASCEFGNLLLIPIKDSLLWVRPLYVQSEQNQLPSLDKVIIAYQDKGGNTIVKIGDTFYQALVEAFCPATVSDPTVPCAVPLTQEQSAAVTPPSQQTQPPNQQSSPSTTAPPSTQPQTPGGLTGPNAQKAQALAGQLGAAFNKAQQDLKNGDLQAWAADITNAQSLASQLQALLGPATPPPAAAPTQTTPAVPPSTAAPPTTAPSRPTVPASASSWGFPGLVTQAGAGTVGRRGVEQSGSSSGS